jgi:Rrf2 family protein
MRLTRASDYGVRILVYLAGIGHSARATREAIIENTGVPAAFLNKIVQRLVRAGLVSARPGVRGGCSLAVAPQNISVLRVVESLDGPVQLSECLADPSACPRGGHCTFRLVLEHLQREIIRILNGTTIAVMAGDGADSISCIPLDSLSCQRHAGPVAGFCGTKDTKEI